MGRELNMSGLYNGTFQLYRKVATYETNGTISYALTLVTSFSGNIQAHKQSERFFNAEAKNDIVLQFVIYTQELVNTDTHNDMIIRFGTKDFEIVKIDDYIEQPVGNYKAIYVNRVDEGAGT
jgi:hypothetical protein